MKLLATLLMLAVGYCHAADYSFTPTGGTDNTVIGDLANEDGLAYDRNFYVTPAQYGTKKRVSVSVTYSSVTFANVAISSNAWTFNNATITKAAHGLQTGVAVLYTKTAGNDPNPLVDQTTYYAIRMTANTMKLATTKQNAVDGTAITLGSTTYSGTQTYTFSALAISGTPSFKFQCSNDASGWADVNTSSITMSAYTTTTSAWDFTDFNFSDLKLKVIAPTTGAILLKAKAFLID